MQQSEELIGRHAFRGLSTDRVKSKIPSFLVVLVLVASLSDLLGSDSVVDAVLIKGKIRTVSKGTRGQLDLGQSGKLLFTWPEGTWQLNISEIRTAYLFLSRQSVLESEILGFPVGVSRELRLSLRLASEKKRPGRVVFAITGLTSSFVEAFEAHGIPLVFESYEARRAIQDKRPG